MVKVYSRVFALALVVLAAAAPAAAQTTPTVPAGTPVRIGWEYPTAATGIQFAVVVDNTIVKNFTASELTTAAGPTAGDTSFQATMPGLNPGVRVLKLRASLAADQSLFAESLPLTVNVSPTAPKGFKIIVTPTASGNDVLGVQLEFSMDDGTQLKEFVPVAHRRTGAFLSSMFLASPTILVR